MTTKEIAIQNVEDEINQKERQLGKLQEEISLLKEKLEEYRNIPDSYYDTTLESCEDFPLLSHWCYRIADTIGTFDDNGFMRATINDLMHSSPKKLLTVKGFGNARLKLVEDWMEKHNLHFLS